jgi:hypothetical protein
VADLFTIADAKAWMGLDPNDTTRDVLLQSLVDAASEACIKEIGHNPLSSQRTEVVNGRGGSGLPLNHFPITAVASVTINARTGGTAMPAALYTFDDNLIYCLDGSFPYGIKNITVVYTAGFTTCPAPITLAAKYTCKAFWDARLIDMNSTGESWSEVGGSSFWPTGPGSVPPQAIQLLNLYGSKIKV